MSTTNRAFIKAYRQDAPEDSPRGDGSSTIRNQAATPIREAAVRTSTTVGSPARSNFGPQPSGQKRPLSSYIARPHSSDTTSHHDSVDFLHPGTTIASLQWPKICRTLCADVGPQLDRLANSLRAHADAGRSLIGIMGLFPRVGATTAALCLAMRAARHARRIILVDGNFCHPRIASWLDAEPTVGWDEVLRHAAPLADALIRANDDNLDVLALGPKAAKNPQTLAASLQAAGNAGVLRHAYDLVLIDIGPFFDPDTQPVVLDLVRNLGIDCVAAVTGPQPADPRDLATIVEYLEPLGCQLLGTIENRVANKQSL
ncbi:MAG TPA: hypothetical protein VHE81_04440 [Lacipirellulaceae bacterium]|nr:hypothetical protein [Lacipirellulaceae bacterium]